MKYGKAIALVLATLGSIGAARAQGTDTPSGNEPPVVYFSKKISAASLLAVYDKLDFKPTGKVGVKVHFGEKGCKTYMQPSLLKEVVTKVGGTFVDTNTNYGGSRGSTQKHLATAKEHGFTYAPVEILDANGETTLPFSKGKHFKQIYVGSGQQSFGSFVVISHFKGHGQAGFGGAIKNLAMGLGSPKGKRAQHGGYGDEDNYDAFQEKMAEYACGSVANVKCAYLTLANNITKSCDCIGSAQKPFMKDVGVLASLDPVALDQATYDVVNKAAALPASFKSGMTGLQYAETLGLGTRKYKLVEVD